MKIKNYKGKAWHYNKKTKVGITFEIEDNDERWNNIDFLNRKLEYNEWLAEHIVNFCPWDYSYNIHLFADSLDQLGKNMIEYGHGVNSIKGGRRTLNAAALLRDCNESSSLKDKSCQYLYEGVTHVFTRGENYTSMTSKYKEGNAMGMEPNEYYNKMWKISHDRCEKIDKEKWSFVWGYLKKYLRHMWD